MSGTRILSHSQGKRIESAGTLVRVVVSDGQISCSIVSPGIVQTSSEGSNRYGRANTNYPVLETYTEGSILEVKIVVSTTHMVSSVKICGSSC